MRKWATVSHCVLFSCSMTSLLYGEKGQEASKVSSWTLKLGSRELSTSLYPKFILAHRLLSPALHKRNIASSRDEMLSKQISGQSLPLLPLPRSHLHIFVRHPRCLFPCPLRGAGWVCWLSAQLMQLCRCELPLAGKREGSCLGNSLKVWADDFHPSL